MADADLFYVSRDGDVLDHIVLAHYGSLANGQLVTVLDANPGLADAGTSLDLGIRIRLPSIVDPAPAEGVRLWS